MDQPLIEIARSLGQTRDLSDLLPVVLARATELFEADRALFAICDEQGRVRRAVRHNLPAGDNGKLPISESVVRKVIETRRSVAREDTSALSQTDSMRMHQIACTVAVPVLGPERVLGVIYIDSTVRFFGASRDKRAHLEAMAGLVSMAIQHLQEQEQHEFRYRYAVGLVHNLRSPLAGLMANAETLLRSSSDEDRRAITRDVLADADRMSVIVASVIETYRLSRASARQPVELNVVAEIQHRTRALDRAARTMTGHPIAIASDGEPVVHTDSKRLGMILDELLLNAIKYARYDTPVRVDVRTVTDGRPAPDVTRDARMLELPAFAPDEKRGFVRVEVSNQNRGDPLDPALLARIFEPFVQGDTDPQSMSSGLGLSIVQELTHSLGGDIVAESDSAGTRFAFDLPVAEPVAEPVETAAAESISGESAP